MIEIVSIIFLLVSFAIAVTIFWRKIPILAGFPEETKEKKESFLDGTKRKINSLSFLKDFSWNKTLLKILSKIRVVVIKIENKISGCLETLRVKSQKEKKKK